jgi:hypothetical protein
MTTKHNGPHAVIAYVARHMACTSCGASYRQETVQVVLHEDACWVLMATCPACDAARAITAFDHPPYAQLQAQPVPPITVGPITRATVQHWAAYLDGFAGDIYDLFAG